MSGTNREKKNMTDTTKVALDRNEMLRRRAARSKYRFKLYGFEEMSWFANNPTDWDEECRLDGTVDMGPHLDDPDDPRVDAAIAERKPKRRSRRRR
jgi:hypothetical protein